MDIHSFWQTYAHQPYDLMNGQVVAHQDDGFLHEVVTNRIQMVLSVHVEDQYLGEVLGRGAHFALGERNLRSADAAFIGTAKLGQLANPELYLPFPPDLMIQIISPRWTSTEIQENIMAFLEAGTQQVWIIDPPSKQVTRLDASGEERVLNAIDWLSSPMLLGDFSIRVEDIFPPLDMYMGFI